MDFQQIDIIKFLFSFNGIFKLRIIYFVTIFGSKNKKHWAT